MLTIDVTGLRAVRTVYRIDAKGETSIERRINGFCHSLPILSVVAEKEERYLRRFGYRIYLFTFVAMSPGLDRSSTSTSISTQRCYLSRILYLSNLLNFLFSFLSFFFLFNISTRVS